MAIHEALSPAVASRGDAVCEHYVGVGTGVSRYAVRGP